LVVVWLLSSPVITAFATLKELLDVSWERSFLGAGRLMNRGKQEYRV
jgi:hypothetical protein